MTTAWTSLRFSGAVFAVGVLLACGSRSSIGYDWSDDAPSFGGAPSSGGVTIAAGGARSSGGERSLGGAPSTGGASLSGGALPVALGGTANGGAPNSLGGATVAAGGALPKEPPVVLVLLDASSSMYDRQVWWPTYEALTGPTGPFQRYQHSVRLGLTSYRGTRRTSEEDPACAELQSVPFALGNAEPIREVYSKIYQGGRGTYETPTAHALQRVTEQLLAGPANARKYVILISDGTPDTCATTNPACGQDRLLFAVQSAFRERIQTRAIGISFGNDYGGCSAANARCGRDHFQDLANAGSGLPVLAPPAGYSMLPCAVETDGQLLAQYSAQGASARFAWTTSPQEVAGAVEGVLSEILASN